MAITSAVSVAFVLLFESPFMHLQKLVVGGNNYKAWTQEHITVTVNESTRFQLFWEEEVAERRGQQVNKRWPKLPMALPTRLKEELET